MARGRVTDPLPATSDELRLRAGAGQSSLRSAGKLVTPRIDAGRAAGTCECGEPVPKPVLSA